MDTLKLAQLATRQVVDRVATLSLDRRSGHAELRLDPPELGRLLITFDRQDGVLQINVSAERDDALDLMRRHSDLIRIGLEDAGLGSSMLEFRDDGKAEFDDTDDARSDSDGVETIAVSHADSRSTGRLDLRI